MEYYDEIATGYNELHEKEQAIKFMLIKEHLKIKKGDTLLDVGCGTGLLSEYFESRIVGLESSSEMLKKAKIEERVADYVRGKAEYLPFKDKSFNCVICVTAIHNFDSPKKALLEIKRVSRGSGAITILKKAAFAKELQMMIKEIFSIRKELEEEKDTIYLF
jgi:ubiquinone/menaquinone biosynthesis C-methylase UbiE